MQLSRLESSLLRSHRGPFLSPDGDGGGASGDNSANANNANPGGKEGDGNGAEAFKPITSEADLAQYKADLRKNIAADLRRSIKAELDAERTSAEEAARKKKEIDDAAAKGEFETAKKSLETDLQAAKDEAASLQARLDQYQTALESGLNDAWAKLPEEIRKIGEKQHDENDTLARFSFLHDADTQALVAKLSDKAETSRGNGPNPKPGGTGTRSVEDEAKALNQSGSYAM
jgi:hypothetical protein